MSAVFWSSKSGKSVRDIINVINKMVKVTGPVKETFIELLVFILYTIMRNLSITLRVLQQLMDGRRRLKIIVIVTRNDRFGNSKIYTYFGQ